MLYLAANMHAALPRANLHKQGMEIQGRVAVEAGMNFCAIHGFEKCLRAKPQIGQIADSR